MNRFIFAMLAGALCACGPTVPSTFPAGSAAADNAMAAPTPSLATALREDPRPGWVGLGSADAGMTTGMEDMPGMSMPGDGGHAP